MKTMFKTSLAALLILMTISCKKENSSLKSSPVNVESSSKDLSADNAVAATTLIIGTQRWMTTNLNVSKYKNGDKIPQVKNPSAWAALTTGAWCYYNNDPATGAVYGKLYNWYAVNDPRGLAPVGFHVPSDVEWATLSTFLGGDLVAGSALKEAGTTHWWDPNTDATNSSGFTGLPGGYRSGNGTFNGIGGNGYLWSSTQFSTNFAWYRYLVSNSGSMGLVYYEEQNGFSVRCIKD